MSFCDTDIAVNCDECYELSASDCLPITIPTSLTPATVYWLICVDKFDNRYDTQVTVNGSGDFIIDPDDFPTGLFNQFAGKFVFLLSVSAVDVIPVQFSVSSATYECVVVSWSVTCCNNTYVPPTACETFIDGLSATELACICDNMGELCPSGCLDATVNVNGNLFDTVASGGTLNVPVKNTDGDAVGSIVAGEVIAPDATADVYDTAANLIANISGASGTNGSLIIPNSPVSVRNSLNNQIASGSVLSVTGGNVSVSDVNNVDSDGSVVPTPAGVVFTCTTQVKSLFSKFTWESGDDTTSTVTIDADSAGTYISETTDGASGTITYSKNGGAYAAFVNPTTYSNGDTLAVKRTITTSLGWVKITGTYV